MEVLTKKSKATHKILVLSLSGDDKGKSKSITICAPDKSKEEVMVWVVSKLNGGNENEN